MGNGKCFGRRETNAPPREGSENGRGQPPERRSRSSSVLPVSAWGTDLQRGTSSGNQDSALSREGVDIQERTGSSSRTPGLKEVTNESDVQRSTDAAPVKTIWTPHMLVTFRIKPEMAEELHISNGEKPENLHVTLAYLGAIDSTPPAGKLNPASTPDIIRNALSTFARGEQSLSGTIDSTGHFPPRGGSSAFFANPNVPGLHDFRNRLVQTLETEGYDVNRTFDFSPHITLGYVPDGHPMPVCDIPRRPLVFDQLCLSVGDDHHYFPLK